MCTWWSYIMIEVKKEGGRVRNNPIILCDINIRVRIEKNQSTYSIWIWDQLEWSCRVRIEGFEVDELPLKERCSVGVIEMQRKNLLDCRMKERWMTSRANMFHVCVDGWHKPCGHMTYVMATGSPVMDVHHRSAYGLSLSYPILGACICIEGIQIQILSKVKHIKTVECLHVANK